MPAPVQVSKLTKCYGSTVAVSGLSFEVEAGEVFGLLGPNGAGKSTTLYMLAGLVRPSSGGVSIFGKDLRSQFLSIAPRMGVFVERPAFYDFLTARRNLMLLATLSRREVNVDRVLDLVNLRDVANRKVGTYSQGMRQRLGLAQALLTEPSLLILDEPTNGLDPESTQDILRLLRRLATESGVTILFSSHLLHEVETLCDRVAIINSGRLVSCERTDALLSYDTSRVDVLIDCPEAASKRLMDQEWVEAVEVKPGRMEVQLRNGSVHQLNSFLVGSGYRISGVIPRRRTLQDYFLEVVKP
ncbi:MAG: ABC transporter ATP-binding protein [FCB group bacterium]|jgi:ABC-2 type transport system ATP-binding protein|nr:ABC transporter ATP-binding protein [FCB group bacterium]